MILNCYHVTYRVLTRIAVVTVLASEDTAYFYTDVLTWSGLCVGLSVALDTTVNPAKTAQPIKMAIGMLDQRNQAFDDDPESPLPPSTERVLVSHLRLTRLHV